MANTLKRYIQQKLSENIPLAQIKDELQKRGYSLNEVNKAVREAIGGMGKKLSNVTMIQIGILIIGVVIAVGVGVYLTTGSKATKDLCGPFRSVEYEISCESAVSKALADSPGIFRGVSIGTLQIPDVSADTLQVVEKNLWLVDIELEKPYSYSGKETKLLRVGIGLNDDTEIHRRPL